MAGGEEPETQKKSHRYGRSFVLLQQTLSGGWGPGSRSVSRITQGQISNRGNSTPG